MRRKETFWLLGFSTCLSLLVEEKVSRFPSTEVIADHQKRRAELGMLEYSQQWAAC